MISTDTDDTHFYFVRHGETEYNRRRIVQGSGIDSELNPHGRTQVSALAGRLSEVAFDAIYASPLQRTRQTTAIIAERQRDVPIQYLADLEEMAWGVYEGEPPSPERNRELDAIKQRWRNGAFDERIEGGESIRDVETRARRAVDQILDDGSGRTVLVVTHGRFLRITLASILEDYDLHQMHQIPHSNTAVNRVVHDGARFTADLINCTAHLESLSNELA
jgi:probable phosphoglycerate mutase